MRFWIYLFAIALILPASARAAMEDYPTVKLQGLDKSTARTTTFEAQVGTTITYGPLFIRIQACRKAPPIEKPESAAFVQIWEVPPETGKSEWVFSGWMFASSPALSAMDHPVYDIWVLDCLGRDEPNEEAKQSETDATVESQDALSAPDPSAPTTETIPSDSEALPATEDVIDSEAQPEEPATDAATPAPVTTPSVDVPVDSEAGAPEPSTNVVPSPESTMPTTLAPQTFNPDAPYDPNAPYSPPPVQGGGVAPYDPNAPYSPSRGR